MKPDESEKYWNLGRLAYEEGEDNKAITYMSQMLDKVEATHAHYCDAHLTIGHCFVGKGQYAMAREQYRAVLSAPNALEEEREMAEKCLRDIFLVGEGRA